MPRRLPSAPQLQPMNFYPGVDYSLRLDAGPVEVRVLIEPKRTPIGDDYTHLWDIPNGAGPLVIQGINDDQDRRSDVDEEDGLRQEHRLSLGPRVACEAPASAPLEPGASRLWRLARGTTPSYLAVAAGFRRGCPPARQSTARRSLVRPGTSRYMVMTTFPRAWRPSR